MMTTTTVATRDLATRIGDAMQRIERARELACRISTASVRGSREVREQAYVELGAALLMLTGQATQLGEDLDLLAGLNDDPVGSLAIDAARDGRTAELRGLAARCGEVSHV